MKSGNVLLGGVTGLGVDMHSGASQDLTPNPVSVKLEATGAGCEARRQVGAL